MVKVKKTDNKNITHEQRVLISAHKTFKAFMRGQAIHWKTVNRQILRIENRLEVSEHEQAVRARRKDDHLKRNSDRNKLNEESDWDETLTESDESFMSSEEEDKQKGFHKDNNFNGDGGHDGSAGITSN